MHHRILVMQPEGEDGRPDIGVGHPHELGLTAVIATGGVRVAVERADRGGVRVHVVAVRVEPAGAVVARPAVDVGRNHHAVAALQVLHRRADLLDDPDELVAEGRADPGVGHHAVVQVQIGAADGPELYAHDRVVRMLDARHVLLGDPHLVGPSMLHRSHRLRLRSWGHPASHVPQTGSRRALFGS